VERGPRILDEDGDRTTRDERKRALRETERAREGERRLNSRPAPYEELRLER
jgi:hypothetical protein